MKVGTYKRIGALLAIAVVFSTVAPVRSSAFESSFISNVVISSHSTGGVSSQGQDGEDGEDGKRGEDGKPGAHGGSVISVDGGASARIESYINDGEEILSIEERGTTASNVETYATSSTHAEVREDFVSSNSFNTEGEGKLSLLQTALNSLQVMIATYVSFLF